MVTTTLSRTSQRVVFSVAGLLLCAAVSGAKERLELRRVSVDLPGAPAVVLSTDLDGDGNRDLVVALAYTEWDQIDYEESSEMQGIDGLVMVMTVIPSLMDRRELRVYLGPMKVASPIALHRSSSISVSCRSITDPSLHR